MHYPRSPVAVGDGGLQPSAVCAVRHQRGADDSIPAGTVASAAAVSEQRDSRYENSPPSSCTRNTVRFAGFRFPPDVIVLAVRWYLRFSLSYRNVEELLAERGIEVDHVTVYRWVQRFMPLLAE